MHKIGFLGPKGTFSQEAVEYYMAKLVEKGVNNKEVFNSHNIKECPFNSIRDIFFALQNDDIDEAIVPIENSIEGAVNETLDLLATDLTLIIKGDFTIPIRQNLLVRGNTKLGNIKYILSHPQPIGQCKDFIYENLPRAEIKLIYSTAGAAEIVAKGEYGLQAAAIGSFIAAKEYGLKILMENIQDKENNFTRFVIISKEAVHLELIAENLGKYKTSVVFSTENKPGSLYRILEIFNLWDINMTRIESRPAKKQLGQYIFFVDIEGNTRDNDVRDALTMVKRKTSFFKLLGSYPSL